MELCKLKRKHYESKSLLINGLGSRRFLSRYPTTYYEKVPTLSWASGGLMITFRTHDCRATLVFTFLHDTIFANWFNKRTHTKIAHQHLVMACAIQTGFWGTNLLSFFIILILIITTWNWYIKIIIIIILVNIQTKSYYIHI